MNESQALQLLQTRPLEFLKTNTFSPAADPPHVVGLHTFYMIDDNRNITYPKRFSTGTGKKFKVRADNSFGGTQFHAQHIPVQASNIAIDTYTFTHNWC